MRKNEHVERYRRSWREFGIGLMSDENNKRIAGHMAGQFIIPGAVSKWDLFCMVHDGREDDGTPIASEPWEHVSVTARLQHGGYKKARIPFYEEMRYVKSIFWEPHEVVMELHVAESDHVNMTDTVLHLWRPLAASIPTPPRFFV